MSRKAGLHVESYNVTEQVERSTSDAETGLNQQQEDSDGLKIEGLALPFGKRSRNGVVYEKESVEEAAETMVGAPILFNHDENNPLGHVTDVQVKKDGLYYVGDLNEEKSEVDSLKRGDIPHVSIQAMIEETENTDSNGEVAVTEFLEMSAVTVPGFSQTDMETEAVMIEKLMTEKEVERRLESLEDPEFETGDFVEWEFGSGSSQGEIVDMETEPGESMSAGGNTFTIDEPGGENDEPLYKMEEWDEEQGEFTNQVVKFESALSETDRPEAAETENRTEALVDFEIQPVPDQVLYEDRDNAAVRARSLGLEDTHEHEVDGKTMFMAGRNHQEWKQAVMGELDNEENVDGDTSKEPFAGYDDFDDCVQQNSDKNDPEAYCAAIKRKVETAGQLKEAVEDVDTTPTDEIGSVASEVLEKIESSEFDNDDCGTRTGLERANQLENQEELSADTINRMVSFFARHDGNQAVDDDVDSKWEDCGFVAWQLWGGDPGREWAERKQQEIEDAKEEILNGEKTGMTNQNTTTEQLEEVAEDDFLGTVADMYEELSASDVASMFDEFEFSGNPEPLVAQLADVAGVRPADLMELLERELEGMHGDKDEDEEDEAGDMDDEEDEEETAESESSNKNAEDAGSSQQDDDMNSKSKEELVQKVEEQENQIQDLREMVEKLEDVEGSKQDSAPSSSEDGSDSPSLKESAIKQLSRR